MNIGNKVLFVSPHTDDEVACAATLSRFIEEGKEVYYVYFSPCKESVPEGHPSDILVKEFVKSMEVLGIPLINTYSHDYEVRRFPQYRQEILENLVMLNRTLNPDIVILPSTYDYHQDHKVIHSEGKRAFRYSTILGFEFVSRTLPPEHRCFFKIEQRHLEKKMEAARCYKSQEFRHMWDEDMVKGLARIRGHESGVELAEAFEVIQMKVS